MNRPLGILLAALGVAALGVIGWAALSAGAGTAAVTVVSDPGRASVWIDGHYLGATPVTRDDLPPGRHVLRVVKFGHKPLLREIDLRGGPNEERVALVPLVGGTLSIATDPPGAEVVVDGESRGVTPVQLKAVAPGGHALRLSLVNYLDWTGSVEIEEDRTAEVKAELKARTEAHLLEAIKLKPKDAGLTCELGHYYIVRGEWEKAEGAYAQSLILAATESQDSEGARRLPAELEKVFRSQFNYAEPARGQEAIVNALTRALQKCPGATSYYSLAVGYAAERGLSAKGQEIIETGIINIPYDFNWAVQTIQRRWGEGSTDRYIEQLNARLKREPGDFVALFQRAVLLRQKGQNDLAVADFAELAKKANSVDAKARLLEECGRLYERLKDFEHAATSYADAAKAEPQPKDRAPVFYNLARVLTQLNRADAADAAWKDAVAAQPDLDAACRWRLEWAQFNINAGRKDRAQAVLDEILRLSRDERTRLRAQELIDQMKKS